jgi:hypothetical protein
MGLDKKLSQLMDGPLPIVPLRINKNSLTAGKPWLENGELIYINLSFLFQ